MEQKNLADLYHTDPIPWSRAVEQLEAAAATPHAEEQASPTTWLTTTRPDGRPHAAAVGALWADGRFYFTSGAGTRKSRNLAENPVCVISVSLPNLDLVVEGTAAIVTDDTTLQHLAELYAAQGWTPEVSHGAFIAEFSAPSAGPLPWDLDEVTPVIAFGVATADPLERAGVRC